ncbi:hypothetical protein [Paenibacillus sp. TC-CSREp1]|uniref:hypothetical protein n=1 Tax=Paenibacillus sp. TC-CSREp1 TaxID=3410089 RepID=UPI003CF63CAE
MDLAKQFSDIASLVGKIDEANKEKERALHDKITKENEHIQSLRQAVERLNHYASDHIHFISEFKETANGTVVLFDLKFAKASIKVRELLTSIENSTDRVPDYKNIILDLLKEKLKEQVK